MTRTYVDSGVLIAAATMRVPSIYQAALAVLDDSDRQYVSSPLVRLEVIPKAIYYRQDREVGFYENFFAGVVAWAESLDQIVEVALREASYQSIQVRFRQPESMIA